MNRIEFLDQFKDAIGLKFDSFKNNVMLILEVNPKQLQVMFSLCASERNFSLTILKAAALEETAGSKILSLVFMFPEASSEIILRTTFSSSEDIPQLGDIWPFAKIWESEFSSPNGSNREIFGMEGVQWHQC